MPQRLENYMQGWFSQRLALATNNYNIYDFAPIKTNLHFMWAGDTRVVGGFESNRPSPWLSRWYSGKNAAGAGSTITMVNEFNSNQNFELKFMCGASANIDSISRFVTRWDLRLFEPPSAGTDFAERPAFTVGAMRNTNATNNRYLAFAAWRGYNINITQAGSIIWTGNSDNNTSNVFWMNYATGPAGASAYGTVFIRATRIFTWDCPLDQGCTGAQSSTFRPAIQFNTSLTTSAGRFEHNNFNYQIISSSDYRLKTNVRELDGHWTVLDQIQPRIFNWVADPTGPDVQGFLAHEVQAVLPREVDGELDAVDDQGQPRYQMLDPSILLPYLTAGIQDLAQEIQQLRSMIDALE